jgi:hypothetical protein
MDALDYVQCMPEHTEVRINLWNKLGPHIPSTLNYHDVVAVTITSFDNIPRPLEHIEMGNFCSKNCQC